MTDFIHFIENDFIQFIDKMCKVIELTCVGMVNILKYILGVQRVDEDVHIKPFPFFLIPGEVRTQKMCSKAMRENPAAFFFVPDHFKTQEMCEKVVKESPWHLKHVPDHLKIQEMCKEVVDQRLYLLQHVPDWFVTQQVNPWHNDKRTEWYEGYKKRRVQKAQIKKELMPIAWHPSWHWDWCMSDDEKKETEKLWA